MSPTFYGGESSGERCIELFPTMWCFGVLAAKKKVPKKMSVLLYTRKVQVCFHIFFSLVDQFLFILMVFFLIGICYFVYDGIFTFVC